MQFVSLSFSHNNTPIALREQLALEPSKRAHLIKSLHSAITSLNEVLLLSTCNRVELYLYTRDASECVLAVLEHLAHATSIPRHVLEAHCHRAYDKDAIHHVFSVVSGLDSIVLGESQIVSQMKEAYKQCFELQASRQEITRLMHFAFRTAARVRTETAIAKSPLSIASVAVKKALESKPSSMLILGAGEMASLAARHAIEAGVAVCMSNRTYKHALHIASTLLQEQKITHIMHLFPTQDETSIHKAFNNDIDSMPQTNAANTMINAMPNIAKESSFSISSWLTHANARTFALLKWQDMPLMLNEFTIIISATSAQEAVIMPAMCEDRAHVRYWFDLAVPRDIDEGCKAHNIALFCVDDLEQVIAENRLQKQEQATQAYRIIGSSVLEYERWLASLDVLPLIKAMRAQAKEASLQEVARAIKKGYLPSELEEEVLRILHNAFNVFLHTPTLQLKHLSSLEEGDMIIQALQRVFGIEDDVPSLINRYKCEYDTTL